MKIKFYNDKTRFGNILFHFLITTGMIGIQLYTFGVYIDWSGQYEND